MKAIETVFQGDRARLSEAPVGAIYELLDELAQGAWSEAEGLRLLAALRGDARPAVRRAVAETVGRMVGSLTIGEAVEILHSLSDDQDEEVRGEVARALAAWLARSERLWQIVIIEQWAASPMRLTRETLAKAFSFSFETPVADLVLELLAQDPVASIRLEVVKALGSRLDLDPSGSAELLTQLAMDPKGPVRWQARRWLRRLSTMWPELELEEPAAIDEPRPSSRPTASFALTPSVELA